MDSRSTLHSSGDKDHVHIVTASRPHSYSVDDIEVCTESSVPPILTVDDWIQPNDPENPYSWPIWKKMYHSLIPTTLAFVISLGISIYPPSIESIAHEFAADDEIVTLGLTLYVIGLAFGPLLGSPLSEMLGRRSVYLFTIPVFGLFSLGAGLARNTATIMICRFLAGFFGGPVIAIGPGTLADMYTQENRAFTTTLFSLSPFLATAIGPVIGGFVAERRGWQWAEWTLLFFITPAYIFSLFMQETYKKTILQHRARKLGLAPTVGKRLDITITLTTIIVRPLNMLLTEPIVASFGVYIAFNFAVLYGFLSAVPFVFSTVYGFTPEQQNLPFLGIGMGCILAVPTTLALDSFIYQKQHSRYVADDVHPIGVVPPEQRLYGAMLGSIGIPIGLFWFGWSARHETNYIVPVLALIPFAWGNLCIFISAILYMVDTYKALHGASVLAANGVLRYVVGGIFPLFAVQIYQRVGIEWASSLLGFITIALLPIPWALFKWGPSIRKRSNYYTI